MKQIVLIGMVGLLLGACGAPPDGQAPVAVVQRFVAGLEARDVAQILAQLPPDQPKRQIAPEIRAYLSVVERMQFREPVYTVLENNGSSARVRLTATLEYTLRGVAPRERPIEAEFDVVRTGEVWYLDGITWPALTE
jgi:hypothetical protein